MKNATLKPREHTASVKDAFGYWLIGKVPGNTLGALMLKIKGFNEPTVDLCGTSQRRGQ